MAVNVIKQIARYQPPNIPAINWYNPITNGLVGLLYTGPEYSRELVGPAQWATENYTGIPKFQTQYGIGTGGTSIGANTGICSARHGVETAFNSSANWRLSSPPLTLAVYGGDIQAPASSSGFAGITGNNQLGYQLSSLYGTSTRGGACNLGANDTRSLIDGASHFTVSGDTTWYTGTGVKAYSIDSTSGYLFDQGKRVAYKAEGSSSIAYDTTYGHTMLLGDIDQGTMTFAGIVYWSGLWNRVLSDAEHKSLNDNPWQLFTSTPLYIPFKATIIWKAASDFSTSGWVTNSPGSFASAINEISLDLGSYITSPSTATTLTPLIFTLNEAMPADTYNLQLNAKLNHELGKIRMVLLDASNVVVGTSTWLMPTSTFTTYSTNISCTGTATKFRLEIGMLQ